MPGRSRSRDRAVPPRDAREPPGEPTSTLILKGVDPRKHQQSGVDMISLAFRSFATIKDVRFFARRGVAFVQFHSIEDATTALRRFDTEYQGRLDGDWVTVSFAQDREHGRMCDAERTFLAKQAAATASANAELEALARQQAQEENITKAMSGVNASMWASYIQSVASRENLHQTVQSAFEYDKASGYYLDKKASLFYDPNTTYFFTTDYKKYFVYDHEERMLCHVDSKGKKVQGGERRPLQTKGPTKVPPPNARRHEDRDRSASRRREWTQREWDRGREQDQARRREHDRDPARGAEHEHERERERRTEKPTQPEQRQGRAQENKDARPQPIHYPGGDPLARLAPAPAASQGMKDGRPQPIHYPGGDPLAKLAPAPDPAQTAAATKKRKKKSEEVLGLATTHHIPRPGRVQVFTTPQLGPVTVAGSASAAASSRPLGLDTLGDWICELCMRKFGSEEQLRRHEQLSDLHKENLAKLQAQS